MASSNSISLPRDAYTVGWVCVLAPEITAARVLLDERHKTPDIGNSDYSYYVGRMGAHNVAITWPTGAGKSAATAAVTNLVHNFPNIRFVLMVGVGGGATNAPSQDGLRTPNEDIFLGDVVVSSPHADHGGVLQYDMGVQHPGGYQIRSHLNKPGTLLTQAAKGLQTDHRLGEGNMHDYIRQVMHERTYFQCPDPEDDLLFEPEYHHRGIDTERFCQNCDRSQLVNRTRRDTPHVYYGLIASADTIMRDGRLRDAMRKSDKVLCFEMEAAGLMDSFPCLVIRGISDYADSHKNDLWKPYAALTAAAYAKDFLSAIQPRTVEQAELALPLLEKVEKSIAKIHTIMKDSERDELLKWLSPLDFQKEQDMLIEKCVSSGKSVIESEVFQCWVKGSPWQLRCYGAMGVGKTYLCALIVNRLQQHFPQRPVIYIYLSDEQKQRESQTRENVLGSLVQQLILFNGSVYIPSNLREASKSQPPREAPLKDAFEELLRKYERTYLVVDGFYQCSSDVLQILKDYPLELIRKDVPLSLLTTSPGYRQVANEIFCDICKERDLKIYFNCHCNDSDFDRCLKCKNEHNCPNIHSGEETYDTVRIEVRPTEEEIRQLCSETLSRASSPGPGISDKRVHPEPRFNSSHVARLLRDKSELRQNIAAKIAIKAQGNFLVAQAWLEALLHAEPRSPDSLLDRMEYNAFEVLERSCTRKIEHMKKYNTRQALGFKVFRVLMTVCRPINILTLQHALALESHFCLDSENLEHRVSILKATNGLVTIDKANEEKSFVRFFHGTLNKVLSKSDLDPSLERAETKMASLCLSYFDHPDYADHAANLAKYPFLSYTLQHWGDHVRRACDKHHSMILDDAHRFLKDPNNVKAVAREAGKVLPRRWIHEGISAIHICAWFGLHSIVEKLRGDHHSITELDSKVRRTPLQYACRRGHLFTVKKFLEWGAPPSNAAIMDAIYGFPEMDRDEEERVDIARTLLGDRTLNASIDSRGTTVLMFAVRNGYYDFVDTLLRDQSVDVNATDRDGDTALGFAVDSEPAPDVPLKTDFPDGIVGLLRRKGADPSIQGQRSERSVLARALSLPHSSATATLSEHDGLEPSADGGLPGTACEGDNRNIMNLLRSTMLTKGKLPDMTLLGRYHPTALATATLIVPLAIYFHYVHKSR